MSGAQGYIQINGPESPREGGRGAIRPPGLPPHRPYSRPRSREEFESLHHPVPSKSLTPSHWSLDYEEDLPVSPRRERNGRYYPRAASPRRIEPGPQYNDIRGSRPTLTAREDLSTYHVVQIDMCMFDDAGYPLERAWERVKCFIVHVTEEEALRKIAKLERETEPVLDKIQNNLTSLMREQLEYGRKFLESEEDPCSAYDLVQFETKIQKVNHSLRGSREELYEDWGRGDKKRSKSKDRKKHKTKISSKNHRKHKSTKDRERSSSSRSKYIEAPVAITAYFKRTPFQEEPRPRLFREREDEAWEDNEMQQYRRSPVEYHQQDRQYSRGGRDAQHYSNYPAMHSPSNSSSHSALAQERYAGRDHREPYDEGYRGQSGMNQHERPVGNHHQQQQQYNMPQQQPQQQPHVAQQQQQQHNMHQQSQPAMAQQRPQQQQDQHNVGHQGGNHQNLQGFPPANQQRQAPVAPQGQGGMMQQPQQQQQQQHQPVVNQQKQQVQPQMAHQQQHHPQQQQQVQPQMMHQQHQQQQHHPQPQQQAQPQMAQQHQQQPPAVVQQKQQVQPQMAQQQQQQQQHKPQQQPQPQQQHAQPGMAQRQQPAPNQQQPQPAMVHQHGQQHPGQQQQQQQQKGQAMPPQAAAQMKGQAAQKAMGGKDKGPQPPPPHVPPALRIQTPASIEKAGRSQHAKKMSKGSPKRHRAHPESPDFSESSGSEVWSESEDDVSTPATSTSGGSHHKSKKSPTRYKEEHFGNPARHHVKPGTRFIDEQGYEREGPPPSRFIHEIPSTSPRKVYAEDLGYSPKISSSSPRKIYTEDLGYLPKKSSSSPRASYGEDEEYFRKATRSPQRTYRNERGNSREASPSPRRGREDFNRSPTAHLSSRRDDPARRILQNVRRMSPELGQEILDEERSWTRNRANRSPLEEDRTRGRTGRPHERDGDYDFVEKRRRPSAKDFPEVKNYRYDGHYGRGAQESRHRSDDSEKYTKYRDYSRSPERPRGARRATYETR